MDFSYKQLELIYETFRKSDLPSYRQIAIIAWNRMFYAGMDEKIEGLERIDDK